MRRGQTPTEACNKLFHDVQAEGARRKLVATEYLPLVLALAADTGDATGEATLPPQSSFHVTITTPPSDADYELAYTADAVAVYRYMTIVLLLHCVNR